MSCSHCGTEKDSAAFYAGHKQCKQCVCDKQRARRAANPQKYRERDKDKHRKRATAIKAHRSTPEYRERHAREEAARRARDPERTQAQNRAAYWRNREKRLAYEQARQKLPEYQERTSAYREATKDHRQRLARLCYRADPAKVQAKVRAWRRANPKAAAAISRRAYRARRLRKHGPAQVAYTEILAADPCCYCGGTAKEIDHIVPVSASGTSDWTNLTSACRSCNASKNARPLLLFLLDR